MWNSEEFYDKLVEGWERAETRNGVSYYVNHDAEQTQWDHPLFVKTLEEMVDMDSIRYAAYRTAMKLRFLQKRLSLDLVELNMLTNIFERHGCGDRENSTLGTTALWHILLELFKQARSRSPGGSIAARMNVETVAELVMNWLLNLFDSGRKGCVRVVAVKISLAALCSARLSEKYRFFFSQLKDHTNHMSEKKLGCFLHDIMQIPELVGEGAAFGGLNVRPAVLSCLSEAWRSSSGITEEELINWLLKEPQTVVWLPTMHRMAAAESVKHENKCSVCKVHPIIGFRYRCLKCFNYDLCQQCFFSGRCNRKHKLKHPTQEYCLATDTKENTKAFMKTVRNNFSKKHRNKKKLCYLPVHGTEAPYRPDEYTEEAKPEDQSELETDELLNRAANQLARLGSSDKAPPLVNHSIQTDEVAGSRGVLNDELVWLPRYSFEPDGKHELENVIHKLENENRQLLCELDVGQPDRSGPASCSGGSEESEREWFREERDRMEAKQEILETHNRQLELQLQKLSLLIKQQSLSNRVPLGAISQNIPVPQGEATKSGRSIGQLPPPAYTPDASSARPPYRLDGAATQLVPECSPIGEPLRCGSDGDESDTFAAHPRTGALAQQLFSSTPDYDHVRQLPANASSYGTLGDTLAQTHFSLPSASQSRNFPDEEAELGEMIDRLDRAYPADETRTLLDQPETTIAEMYAAAQKIGTALSEFLGDPSGAHNSMAEETSSPEPQQQHQQQQLPLQPRSPQSLQQPYTEDTPQVPGPTLGLERSKSESTSEA